VQPDTCSPWRPAQEPPATIPLWEELRALKLLKLAATDRLQRLEIGIQMSKKTEAIRRAWRDGAQPK
jgi:hypothetical protein